MWRTDVRKWSFTAMRPRLSASRPAFARSSVSVAPWQEIFANLYRVGYDGDCIIEHEDKRFEATDQLIKRGFLLARNILRPYIPKGY